MFGSIVRSLDAQGNPTQMYNAVGSIEGVAHCRWGKLNQSRLLDPAHAESLTCSRTLTSKWQRNVHKRRPQQPPEAFQNPSPPQRPGRIPGLLTVEARHAQESGVFLVAEKVSGLETQNSRLQRC